jgi:hypothetical protein
MKRGLQYLVFLLAVYTLTSVVFGIGGDHKGFVGGGDKWPDGLKELANRDDRVHGYFVNWEDVFFYSGDTQAFNDFLLSYSKLRNTKLELVIHVGLKKARSPWDKVDREIRVDWSLYTTPFTREQVKNGKVAPGNFVTLVELWLGHQVGLDGLEVPANIEVKSAGEVEKFVAEHKQNQTKDQERKQPLTNQ